MSDTALIEQFCRGNQYAFNTLVWRWEWRLYNFILRYTGCREEAQDLCQLAFLKAYKNLHTLKNPERFSSWIYQLTLNVCRDEFRKNHRRGRHLISTLEEEPQNGVLQFQATQESGNPSPEDAACTSDLRDLLNMALQNLPEEQRVVVLMKTYQALTFSEIAEILDIPENTAKSRLYYGLGSLRRQLEAWNINQEIFTHEM